MDDNSIIYETVIRSKKTSSVHFAQKRAEEPVRYCACCGKPIVRRMFPSGRVEPNSVYRKRKFCSGECFIKAKVEKGKVEHDAKMAERYRECLGVEGLVVDRDGNFLFHGRKKNVRRYFSPTGRKYTVFVTVTVDGRRKKLYAARLVYEAFKERLRDGSVIDYIDGDIHNIALRNLHVVDRTEYNKARMAVVASYRKIGTARYQIDRLRNTIEYAMAVLHYFETGDLTEIHRVVKDLLYPLLTTWCQRSLHYDRHRAEDCVTDVITRFYEVVLSGHAVSHPEFYCKKLLVSEKRYGRYGHSGDVPKAISLMVHEIHGKNTEQNKVNET